MINRIDSIYFFHNIQIYKQDDKSLHSEINLFLRKKMGVVPGKAAKLENVGKNFKKTSFGTERLKMGKWRDQTLCIFETPGFVAPL